MWVLIDKLVYSTGVLNPCTFIRKAMQSDIQKLEQQISDNRRAVTLRETLQTLQKNTAFKKVISEGYLQNEVLRISTQLAHPGLQSPESQALLQIQLRAIAQLSEYFRVIEIQGENAASAIEQAQSTIEDILASEE